MDKVHGKKDYGTVSTRWKIENGMVPNSFNLRNKYLRSSRECMNRWVILANPSADLIQILRKKALYSTKSFGLWTFFVWGINMNYRYLCLTRQNVNNQKIPLKTRQQWSTTTILPAMFLETNQYSKLKLYYNYYVAKTKGKSVTDHQ